MEIFDAYLQKLNKEGDSQAMILEHLEWEEPNEEEFAQDVRIVLASAEFSKELTTAVMWLNERDLDIRCVRLKPYRDADRILLDVQQIIPLPEANAYQVQIKEKQKRERQARTFNPDFTKYDITIDGRTFPHLAKRNAIFTVVKHLCDNGVTPEEIIDVVGWRRTSMFRSVDGVVGPEEFVALAIQNAEKEGKRFAERRFFLGDDELIVSENRTYAFTNQWGNRTIEAIERLKEAFHDSNIRYQKSS